MQGRNRDTDIKTRLWTQQGKQRVGRLERAALICIHCLVSNRQLAGSDCVAQGESSVLCDDLEGWCGGGQEGGERRGYTYTYS